MLGFWVFWGWTPPVLLTLILDLYVVIAYFIKQYKLCLIIIRNVYVFPEEKFTREVKVDYSAFFCFFGKILRM